MSDRGTTRPVLYTSAFVTLLLITILGFAHNMMVQPVLPLFVLHRGGAATTVGFVVAAFTVSSVLLRPLFGRLVDEWNHRRVYLIGALVLGLAGIAYVLSNLVALFVVRVVHGTAWAAFNTGGHSAMARLAPSERRGEASGIYNLMPGLARMLGPPASLLLLGAYGFGAPFLVAAGLGLLAATAILLGPLPAFRAEWRRSAGKGLNQNLLEQGALLPMTLESLFTSLMPLFWVYPPVFAAIRGIPASELTLYYLTVGAILVVGRLVLGRMIDRFPRQGVVAVGSVLAVGALGIASGLQTLTGLTIAGAVYALAASFTPPTLMAAAIDRADPRRMGAAMATYTLGFQLGLGAGAAAWGIVIDVLGYPAPYLLAVGLQVLLLTLLFGRWSAPAPTTRI